MRSYSITHPPGRVTLPTQPGWDYLVFAQSGIFTAITERQAWTVPAHRALCVPDGTRVEIATTKRSAIRCLYVDRELDIFAHDLRVLTLTPLIRELVSHAVETSPMDLSTPAQVAAITLLGDRLANEPSAPLHLPLPTDPTARHVASSIMANPALDLDDHLQTANAHRRTIERYFRSETEMSLGQWRRRARILAGLTMLAQGDSVTRVAVTVGYASPSAFVAAFHSELGSPPRTFMQR